MSAPGSGVDDDVDSLLEYLKSNRGFDFSGYKRTSLERRIRKRMDAVGIDDYGSYQDYLEVHPGEYTDLFNTILINVTSFFRDGPAWEFLASDAVPKMLDAIPDHQPIRVWCAACASGEESYTTAMVFAETLGEEEFRERVKIYATDVDEEALAQARLATYSSDAMKNVPEELRAKYFQQNGTGYTFRADLRRSVIFGRNDLVQDAPISRIDLLVSRNALMYFAPEAQADILRRFNFSLNDTGFLFLGRSEMLITHSELFTPYNLHWRVFVRVPQPGMRDRYAFVTHAGGGVEKEDGHPGRQLRDAAVDLAPLAQVVVDRTRVVTSINQKARALFGLTPTDIGRALQDLEISYRPVDLRSALDQAYETQRPVRLGRIAWRGAGADDLTLEVEVTPVETVGAALLGASITFADVTAQAELHRLHSESKRQLESASEELQSAVEELETTNEELQSTNEELETMNEELQSTNDELEHVNEEQRNRTAELDRVNLFLEGILGSLGIGVVVVDRQQQIQLWNPSATEWWGLRSEEAIGENLLGLEMGLPMDAMREPLSQALARDPQKSELTLEAVNRRGRTFECHVRTLPLITADGETYGALVLMSEAGQS